MNFGSGVRLVLLGAVALVTGRKLDWRANWRHHLIIGGVNSALPFLLFAYGALYLPASLLSLFNSLAPIFGAIVAALWLRTPVSRATAVGLGFGVAGVAVLTVDHIAQSSVTGSASAVASALLAVTVAPLCYGIAATYIKWASAKIEPFANAHGAMWAASMLAFPLAVAMPPAHVPDQVAIAAAAVLGLVCTGAAYLLQFRLFADIGPAGGLTAAFLIPVFGVTWGVLLLGEPVSWTVLAGGALVLLGTALVTGVIGVGARREMAKP